MTPTPAEVIAATLGVPYADAHAKRIISRLAAAGYEITPQPASPPCEEKP